MKSKLTFADKSAAAKRRHQLRTVRIAPNVDGHRSALAPQFASGAEIRQAIDIEPVASLLYGVKMLKG
ncbi:MAG: hypothetical protein WCL32_07160 [Planctomycetota bacterium]